MEEHSICLFSLARYLPPSLPISPRDSLSTMLILSSPLFFLLFRHSGYLRGYKVYRREPTKQRSWELKVIQRNKINETEKREDKNRTDD